MIPADGAKKIAVSPFVRFLLTGGFAAAVNIGTRHLLSYAMPFEIAVVLAYLVAMTVGYALARLFVFARSGQTVRNEYARFALVNLVALAQVWLVSVGLAHWLLPAIEWTLYPELTAHTIGVLSPAITSYYGHKLFTFRQV
jgi:putative flippase GtrA